MAEAQMMDTEGFIPYDDDMMDTEEVQREDYDIELVDGDHVDMDIKVVDMEEGDIAEAVDNDQDMVYDFHSPQPPADFGAFKDIDPNASVAFSIATQQTESETVAFGQEVHFSSDLLGSMIPPQTMQPVDGQFEDATVEIPAQPEAEAPEAGNTILEKQSIEVQATEQNVEVSRTSSNAPAVGLAGSRASSVTIDNEGGQSAVETAGEEAHESAHENADDTVNTVKDDTHAASNQEAQSTSHETDQEPAKSQEESPEVERIPPIVCYYDENELCLYPKDFYSSKDQTFSFDGRPYPADYLLPDLSSYSKSFDAIFSGLRDLLQIGEDDELKLVVEELGLTFSEDNRLAQDFTLADVHRLYTRLAGEGEEAMIVYLQTEPRITRRYSELLEAAASGKTINDVSPHGTGPWGSENGSPHAIAEDGAEVDVTGNEQLESPVSSPRDGAEAPVTSAFDEEFIEDDDEKEEEDGGVHFEVTEGQHEEHEVVTEEHEDVHEAEQEDEEEVEHASDEHDAAHLEQAVPAAHQAEETNYHSEQMTEIRSSEFVVSLDESHVASNEHSIEHTEVLTSPGTSDEKPAAQEISSEQEPDNEAEQAAESDTARLTTDSVAAEEHVSEHDETTQQDSQHQQQDDAEDWNELLPLDGAEEDSEDGVAIGEYALDQQEYNYEEEGAAPNVDGSHEVAGETEHNTADNDEHYQDPTASTFDEHTEAETTEQNEWVGEDGEVEDETEQPYEEEDEQHPESLAEENTRPAANEDVDAEADDDAYDNYEEEDYGELEEGNADEGVKVSGIHLVELSEEHLEHFDIIEMPSSNQTNGEDTLSSDVQHLVPATAGDSKRSREDDLLPEDAQEAKRRRSTAPEDQE